MVGKLLIARAPLGEGDYCQSRSSIVAMEDLQADPDVRLLLQKESPTYLDLLTRIQSGGSKVLIAMKQLRTEGPLSLFVSQE